ncbi:MAG TPA: tRNA pseudouridine(38-40) synthase TruA [Thermomicrobiales bacterium]|nr:tRNA pseudouridine(38-40) synthase TruA [Thermomicrobiales bacterium]
MDSLTGCPTEAATPYSRLPTPDSPRRLRLTLAYDGTDFYGAQVQPGRRTVGGELERALARLTGATVRATFAGRTDRGVHADGQVAHCTVATRLDDAALWRALNALLPADLAALEARTAPDDFHARYGARWREYRYRVWQAPVRVPALARATWHVARGLDRVALDAATGALLGEHDFAAFAGQGLGVPGRARRRGTVREVYGARWFAAAPDLPAPPGVVLELRLRASGFLPQMVRTIVAALIEVGAGRQEPEWIAALLAGRDRRAAPAPAPPQGLTLWAVGYGSADPRPAWQDGRDSERPWAPGAAGPYGEGR